LSFSIIAFNRVKNESSNIDVGLKCNVVAQNHENIDHTVIIRIDEDDDDDDDDDDDV
jgi:hypothetical protein